MFGTAANLNTIIGAIIFLVCITGSICMGDIAAGS